MMTSLAVGMEHRILKKINGFGVENRINSGILDATTMKLAVKINNPFSNFFIFSNILTHGHGFNALTVTTSKKFNSN